MDFPFVPGVLVIETTEHARKLGKAQVGDEIAAEAEWCA
jgi:hypothetical protein